MNNNNFSFLRTRASIFQKDINIFEDSLSKEIKSSSFLVIGGGGSIGSSVVKEIFLRNPKCIHVVDISENSLAELVRDLRSTKHYNGELRTFAIDMGSSEFIRLLHSNNYDYIFNLAALKHVRSEKDPFTMSRMIRVNIINTIDIYLQATKCQNMKKYFVVSTDKAANPANFMGATKRLMEKFIFQLSSDIYPISLARFANVAFSAGSILESFKLRVEKGQPIVAPNDIERFFITIKESGELCLLSGLLARNNEIIFPKQSEQLSLSNIKDVAINFLELNKLSPIELSSEEEARSYPMDSNFNDGWPCFFSSSDTSGEKGFEEFFTDQEDVRLDKFTCLGVIEPSATSINLDFLEFKSRYKEILEKSFNKDSLLSLLKSYVPEFDHVSADGDKNLDQKM
jgi:FlaA1/EpsC-like NDP-sugar epimerase